MYLPFLRGKQFELIALRELSERLIVDKKEISPIIEPVKKNSATLRLTLHDLKENNINFCIIINPEVGELITHPKDICLLLKECLEGYSNYQIGFYINSQKSLALSLKLAENINFKYNGFSLIHTSQIDDLDTLKEFDKYNKTLYNIIDLTKTSRRYYRNFKENTRISIEDKFNILLRNSDYANNDDELFSEEHLFYESEGYVGFSDYLTVGESFSETGFLPYAVAIHLTYADKHKKIRIHHFVSDSNEDTTDVAGKFGEALKKLIKWVDQNKIDSEAINEFRELYQNGHFPGLGYIKKLSIKHHIELVSSLI
jgi:hypothetical protein